MIALHCVSSGEFSPTLLMGAVDSAVLCCYPVYFVVSASSGAGTERRSPFFCLVWVSHFILTGKPTLIYTHRQITNGVLESVEINKKFPTGYNHQCAFLNSKRSITE